MNEIPTIVTSCVNCFAPGSLAATFALIVIGAAIALAAERHEKPARQKAR